MKTILLACMIWTLAEGVMAHSPLNGTTPANEAIVLEMPTEVLMEFKTNIRMTRVVITHADSSSLDMDLGNQKTFTQEFTLPMHAMGPGTYKVEWRGLGADGHALNGTFSFTVK